MKSQTITHLYATISKQDTELAALRRERDELRACLEKTEALSCDLWADLNAYGDESRLAQFATITNQARALLSRKGE